MLPLPPRSSGHKSVSVMVSVMVMVMVSVMVSVMVAVLVYDCAAIVSRTVVQQR